MKERLAMTVSLVEGTRLYVGCVDASDADADDTTREVVMSIRPLGMTFFMPASKARELAEKLADAAYEAERRNE